MATARKGKAEMRTGLRPIPDLEHLKGCPEEGNEESDRVETYETKAPVYDESKTTILRYDLFVTTRCVECGGHAVLAIAEYEALFEEG
jgi:hypothetical protein